MMQFINNAVGVLLLAAALTNADDSLFDGTLGRRRLAHVGAFPVQTFFVPMPEESMFKDMFYQINPKKARPGVTTMLSIAVATDNTVIWYDHWEDGYDGDVANTTSFTTEVWGDGDSSNGCSPDVSPCTDNADVLMAGTTVVVQNTINLPRDPTEFFYDGGDRIQASFPIALTRGAYPKLPGSLMAGAVEVLEVKSWGYNFEAPLGMDIGKYFQAFQFSAFFFMAAYDDTIVTLPDGSTLKMNQGDASMVRINQRDVLSSNKLLQVDLITGDVWSYYELRWYSFIGTEDWNNEYVSPVGDSVGKTKVLLYNPNPGKIDVTIDYLDGGSTKKTVTTAVNSKRAVLSNVIPSGSGAWFNSTENFMALSLTDTEFTTSTGQKTGSQWYDWGFPVMPRTLLTSAVMIGWGYGCTNNKCYGQEDRSVVWLTAVQDADIFVDYNNIGRDYATHQVKALESLKVTDQGDNDMSGAIIFATQLGSGPDGPGVDMSAAWGQDPAVSEKYQSISLDLGTVVLPFSLIRVTKNVDKASVKPGDFLTYTIRVINVGNKKIKRGTLTLYDNLDENANYIEHSAKAGPTGNLSEFPDDANSETPFPLDESGHLLQEDITRRGGSYDITFIAQVKNYTELMKPVIDNFGHLETESGDPHPYSAESKVDFGAAIDITNTVYLGHDGGDSCGTSKAVEKVQGDYGDKVTFCLRVTNIGQSKLGDVKVVDEILDSFEKSIGRMEPGDSVLIPVEKTISLTTSNLATVIGTPLYYDWSLIDPHPKVTASDPSAVEKIDYSPNIQVENTVYLGGDNGSQCDTDIPQEKVEGVHGGDVVYCFVVTNIGDTHLKDIVLQNPDLSFADSSSIDMLAPGASAIVSHQTTMSGNLVNTVEVKGNPVKPDGSELLGVDDVMDSDPSEVVEKQANPSIKIENEVYLGSDDGESCSIAVEKVEDYKGSAVVYCFNITNTGDTFLSSVKLDNVELEFSDESTIALLAPGESSVISFASVISKDLLNSASVVGNPATSNGEDLIGYEDVSDVDPSEVAMLVYPAEIDVQNTGKNEIRWDETIELNCFLVYLGHDGGQSCGTDTAEERVTGYKGADTTYCFVVTNIGTTYLKNVRLSNLDLDFSDDSSVGILAPGNSSIVYYETSMTSALVNVVNATALPSTPEGEDMPGSESVSDSDPSEVLMLAHEASVQVLNTVYLGTVEDDLCGGSLAKENVEGYLNTEVVYCFRVANTGNTHLNDIRLTNDDLDFTDSSTVGTLAPGETAMVSFPGSIVTSVENKVTVVANPIDETGGDIEVMPDVTDTDPSSVTKLEYDSAVDLKNTVYLGHNGGSSCGTGIPSELVVGYNGANVTYCFTVVNTGSTHLSRISLLNDDLFFEDESIGVLAPGASAVIPFPFKITADLVNNAKVTARPSTEEGDDLPEADDVEAVDPSEVQIISINPSVTISNTVVYGPHDNGASCSTDQAKEKVSGYSGDEITYCFKVTNTGDVYLNSITIDNTELSFVDSSVGLLAPGSTALVPLQTKITSSHSNSATVTASPSTPTGADILGADNVQATDDSEVDRLDRDASVTVENTVYRGHNGGVSCGTDIPSESVEGFSGAYVTYCFTITNNGETYLGDITIDNADLDFYDDGESIGILAPGNSTIVSVMKLITEDLENTVKVKANPVSPVGKDLPGTDDVLENDTSAVKKLEHNPSVEVDNKVYLGSDGGDSCDTATDKVIGYQGDYVTYCFTVKNTGDTYLNSITVHNGHLSFTDLSVGLLAPGESALVIYAGLIEDDARNVVQVAANPVSSDEEDIVGADDVSDSDPSEVETIDANPRINIKNKVYLGEDEEGAKCGTDEAEEKVEGYYAAGVVYCFTLTNTGDTYLDKIAINNIALDFYDDTSVGVLAPGDSITVPMVSTIEANLENTAEVTANPVTAEGVEITGVDDVTDSDTSEVEKLDHDATILIENNVYLGHDGGQSCDTDAAVSRVSGYDGADVTYCFKVTNTGSTHLAAISIDDPQLSFFDTSIASLAPGETATVSHPSEIKTALENIAVVTANPVSPEGDDLPGTEDATDKDPSEVGLLDHKSGITIANTVYSGHDNGESCNTEAAVESIEGYKSDDVTYCLKITNSGNTHLNRVVVSDPELSYRDTASVGLLAPGDTVTLHVSRTLDVSTENIATVTANPVSATEDDIDGAEDVTASDPSAVTLNSANPSISIENTVYIGTDEGNSCATDVPVERVVSYYGENLVYCFTVENTGDTYLDSVTITNADLDFYDDYSVEMLAPNASVVVPLITTLQGELINTAQVSATPVAPSGTVIVGVDEVTDSDPSEVGQLYYNSSIIVENTVYVGDDGGDSCITDIPKEKVASFSGSTVTYCFKVTNTGETYLNHIQFSNPALSFSDKSMPMLPPGTSDIIFVTDTITADLENTVSVVANPVNKKGEDLPGADDVSDSDPSSVSELSREPSIQVENTVYHGHDEGASCQGVEKVIGMLGDRVTYCFQVTNTGNTFLSDVKLSDTELSFVDETTIEFLAPGQSITVPYEAKLLYELANTVKVQAKPVDKDSVPIDGTGLVMDSDPSEVSVFSGDIKASVSIQNKVYAGEDYGAKCASAQELAEGFKNAGIVFCYKVKNTGQTFLNHIRIATDVTEYPDNSIGILAPGESVLVKYVYKVDGNITNTAIVTADPANGDGSSLPEMDDVTDSDPSTVVQLNVSDDPRTTEKDPYKPPSDPTKCMQDNYDKKGKDEDLVCASQDIYLENLESEITSCVPGETITLTVDAAIRMKSTRYDVGWYVATDGGDSLTGTCVVNGLQDGNAYQVVQGPSSTTDSGYVSWEEDINTNDSCGDVFLGPDTVGYVNTPILVATNITCADENDDGNLDFSLCFTWRTAETDEVCTLTETESVVPGSPEACYCTRYDVPTVSITDPPDDYVAPCR